VLLEVRRLLGDVRKLVEPVDGLGRLAHLLSGEADHATDGRPSRRPWRGRRSDDHQLQAVLGPALERLRRTFTNRASYQHFWREHPAFCDPGIWTQEVEADLDYDLVGEPPLLGSGVSLDAVRRDSQDTLGDSARHALEPVDRPLVLLRAASRHLRRAAGPVSDDVVAAARQYGRIDHDKVVEGTNHYSIVLDARGAAAVAAHCCRREPLQRPAGWVVAGGTAPRFPPKRVEPDEVATTGAGERGG
jgi:hypothetical protein